MCFSIYILYIYTVYVPITLCAQRATHLKGLVVIYTVLLGTELTVTLFGCSERRAAVGL